MEKFKCKIHTIIILIPSTDDEFLRGKYHDNIVKCHKHHEEFPHCRFEKIGEES